MSLPYRKIKNNGWKYMRQQYIETPNCIEQAQIAILENPTIKALQDMKVDIVQRESSQTWIFNAWGEVVLRERNPLLNQLDSDMEAIQRVIIYRYKRIAREAGVDVGN